MSIYSFQVSNIDVKQETPVDHGEIICFSIYSGPEANFGNGKSCIWVDVLDGGGKSLLVEFAPFFEDSSIKKVTFLVVIIIDQIKGHLFVVTTGTFAYISGKRYSSIILHCYTYGLIIRK